MKTKKDTQSVQITPPNMQTAMFTIEGTAPLVIRRIDEKVEEAFHNKIVNGTTPKGKTRFEKRATEEMCESAKYFGMTDGKKWEGFNASAIRLAMISACRLVNFKMTLAKLSLFVVEDGRDIRKPLYPLVRINGKSEKTEMMGRTETGVAIWLVRPMYFPWSANLRIRFDAGQFTYTDIANLLMRVGEQVGIGEGRHDSKKSGGMGWGTFRIVNGKSINVPSLNEK
jgi:hypothetical protein